MLRGCLPLPLWLALPLATRELHPGPSAFWGQLYLRRISLHLEVKAAAGCCRKKGGFVPCCPVPGAWWCWLARRVLCALCGVCAVPGSWAWRRPQGHGLPFDRTVGLCHCAAGKGLGTRWDMGSVVPVPGQSLWAPLQPDLKPPALWLWIMYCAFHPSPTEGWAHCSQRALTPVPSSCSCPCPVTRGQGWKGLERSLCLPQPHCLPLNHL